jgi:hypothetical protein
MVKNTSGPLSYLLQVSDSMYPSSGRIYLFLVVLRSQLGTLKVCVFSTWQKSHSVYVSVSVPVEGVVLLCRWLVCDSNQCFITF